MNASEYQKLSLRTAGSIKSVSDRETMLLFAAVGIGGEAGEIVDDIKKAVFHRQTSALEDKLPKEIGDLLWYLSYLTETIGLDLGDIMEDNIAKLRLRYPEGYNDEAAAQRLDTKKG